MKIINLRQSYTLLTECRVTKPTNGNTGDRKTVYKHLSSITFTCDTDYTLTGDATRTCNDGSLSTGIDVVCKSSKLNRAVKR